MPALLPQRYAALRACYEHFPIYGCGDGHRAIKSRNAALRWLFKSGYVNRDWTLTPFGLEQLRKNTPPDRPLKPKSERPKLKRKIKELVWQRGDDREHAHHASPLTGTRERAPSYKSTCGRFTIEPEWDQFAGKAGIRWVLYDTGRHAGHSSMIESMRSLAWKLNRRPAPEALGLPHDWFQHKVLGGRYSCRSCGVLLNATNRTKPCKGPVRVGPRAAEAPIARSNLPAMSKSKKAPKREPIKPCPFCGGEARVVELGLGYMCRCRECVAGTREVWYPDVWDNRRGSVEEHIIGIAIGLWNRRPRTEHEEIIEASKVGPRLVRAARSAGKIRTTDLPPAERHPKGCTCKRCRKKMRYTPDVIRVPNVAIFDDGPRIGPSGKMMPGNVIDDHRCRAMVCRQRGSVGQCTRAPKRKIAGFELCKQHAAWAEQRGEIHARGKCIKLKGDQRRGK